MNKFILTVLTMFIIVSFVSMGCGKKSPSESNGSGIFEKISLSDFARQQDEALNKEPSSSQTIRCLVRGNSLVYTYQFSINISPESAMSTFESKEATYLEQIEEMRETVIGCDSIILEALDSRGNVIASKEFK